MSITSHRLQCQFCGAAVRVTKIGGLYRVEHKHSSSSRWYPEGIESTSKGQTIERAYAAHDRHVASHTRVGA